MYIRIEEPSGKTIKRVWTFWVRVDVGDRIELVFDSYGKFMRQSPRHRNWTIVERWCRGSMRRDDTLKERPFVDPDIQAKALKQLTEAITVVLDWA